MAYLQEAGPQSGSEAPTAVLSGWSWGLRVGQGLTIQSQSLRLEQTRDWGCCMVDTLKVFVSLFGGQQVTVLDPVLSQTLGRRA